MARKLKTFTTSIGFFDLAIAAPSMKAALEAWGAGFNLFHHGFARQTDDRSIVSATMASPGVVLRRPVGTNKAFTEHAEVSSALPTRKAQKARPPKAQPGKVPPKKSAGPAKPADEKVSRAAALAFEKEQERRERRSRKEEEALQKEGHRRDRAIAAAEAALEEAERAHKRTVQELETAQAALDRKSAKEEARWKKEQERLQDGLRRARSPRHLKLV